MPERRESYCGENGHMVSQQARESSALSKIVVASIDETANISYRMLLSMPARQADCSYAGE